MAFTHQVQKHLSNVFLLGINLRGLMYFVASLLAYDYALHITIDWNEQKGRNLNPTISIERRKRKENN
jgi:hypothetical protein